MMGQINFGPNSQQAVQRAIEVDETPGARRPGHRVDNSDAAAVTGRPIGRSRERPRTDGAAAGSRVAATARPGHTHAAPRSESTSSQPPRKRTNVTSAQRAPSAHRNRGGADAASNSVHPQSRGGRRNPDDEDIEKLSSQSSNMSIEDR